MSVSALAWQRGLGGRCSPPKTPPASAGERAGLTPPPCLASHLQLPQSVQELLASAWLHAAATSTLSWPQGFGTPGRRVHGLRRQALGTSERRLGGLLQGPGRR